MTIEKEQMFLFVIF